MKTKDLKSETTCPLCGKALLMDTYRNYGDKVVLHFCKCGYGYQKFYRQDEKSRTYLHQEVWAGISWNRSKHNSEEPLGYKYTSSWMRKHFTEDEPVVKKYDNKGRLREERYVTRRLDKPSKVMFFADGRIQFLAFKDLTKWHNPLGPSEITYSSKPYKVKEEHYILNNTYIKKENWLKDTEVIKTQRRKKLEQISKSVS